MSILQILLAWFLLSLTGALAPGPLSAAVVMQASKNGKLYGILPMVGHALVELGIVFAIAISVEMIALTPFAIDMLLFFGGIVIVAYGGLALKDLKAKVREPKEEKTGSESPVTAVEATTQGVVVSIFSPYFLLWWFAVGVANVSMLISELSVGLGTVLIAGTLIYLTHISTDFIFGGVLAVTTDAAAQKARFKGINLINLMIGLFQIALGLWFLVRAIVF
ncbi:MAG: LysE family transporter [Promethearchaeia archaeon]